ncbi:type II toxin-antitoxin system VapC family toxin [Armatimonas sp.]|uniref:type II toxin-antitoxin system VapC family toxin n=1 Tax=Armatimonas sp. TaxID=1872638 RepID=UPI003753CE84
MPSYLLDTNIFVHAIRNSTLWQTKIVPLHDPLNTIPACVYSVVTEGELRSLVHQLGWGAAKHTQLQSLLAQIRRLDISTTAILQDYATIDSHCRTSGFTLSKNDLWIAATASALGLTLLTTDKDFDPLDGVFLNRIWIDPT